MKKSSWLMLSLSMVLLLGMVTTDFLLNASYIKIDVNDPFKNYIDVKVKPFTKLHLEGGNSYAIHVRHADSFQLRVMKSRQAFLKKKFEGETLSLRFTVPVNSQLHDIHHLPVGVIIYLPRVQKLRCDGTSLVIDSLLIPSLDITLAGKSTVSISHSNIDHLRASVLNNSVLLFHEKNKARHLSLAVSGDALVSMKGIAFDKLYPELYDSGKVVFYGSTIQTLIK